MKDLKLIISSILIITSFFVWYLFAKEKAHVKIEQLKSKKSVVNLEINKNNINIISSDKNTIVLVNWNEINSGTIVLEKVD